MAAAFTGGMSKALNCFVAGMLVLTSAGLVAIEKIKAGDLVMAADENGNRGLKRVVRTFARQTESIVTVNAGEMAIRCTPEHPFFVEGKGFVFAGDLEAGNILVTEAGGCVMVTSVEADETVNAENTVTVYNFEVEDWHTYYVGEWCVLVHNACEKHHFASNKNKKYTPLFKAITDKFGLKLDGKEGGWNIRDLEGHRGRHTITYHEKVLAIMRGIATKIPNDPEYKQTFIDMFTELLIQEVLDDPSLPYKK